MALLCLYTILMVGYCCVEGFPYGYSGYAYANYGGYYSSSGMTTGQPSTCEDCQQMMHDYGFYDDETLIDNCEK